MGKDEADADRGGAKLEDYRLMCKLGEGTFSEVLKVKQKKTGKISAMKRFRKHFNTFEEIEGLREIQALRRLNPHQHIIDLEDVIFEPKHGILSLNFELMECNLYEMISQRKTAQVITEGKAKMYMFQICKALDYIHGKGIFHRDIKPENILVKDNNLKIADFGSCRGIHSKPPYTEYIATRWYRSPECLLTEGIYSYKMDLWGAGCVLFEIVSRVPLFPGSNELDQLHRIHAVVGTPSREVLRKMLGPKANSLKYNFPPKEGTGIRSLIPHIAPECVDLINALLAYNPDDRITAKETLKHPYFRDVVDTSSESQGRSSRNVVTKSAKVKSQPPSLPVAAAQTQQPAAAAQADGKESKDVKDGKDGKERDSKVSLPGAGGGGAAAATSKKKSENPLVQDEQAATLEKKQPVSNYIKAPKAPEDKESSSLHQQPHRKDSLASDHAQPTSEKVADKSHKGEHGVGAPGGSHSLKQQSQATMQTLQAIPQHISGRQAAAAAAAAAHHSLPAAQSSDPSTTSILPPLNANAASLTSSTRHDGPDPSTSTVSATTNHPSSSSFYAKFKQQMDDKKAAEHVLARARRIRVGGGSAGKKRGGGPSAGRRGANGGGGMPAIPGALAAGGSGNATGGVMVGVGAAGGSWGGGLVGKNMAAGHKLPSIPNNHPNQHPSVTHSQHSHSIIANTTITTNASTSNAVPTLPSLTIHKSERNNAGWSQAKHAQKDARHGPDSFSLPILPDKASSTTTNAGGPRGHDNVHLPGIGGKRRA